MNNEQVVRSTSIGLLQSEKTGYFAKKKLVPIDLCDTITSQAAEINRLKNLNEQRSFNY